MYSYNAPALSLIKFDALRTVTSLKREIARTEARIDQLRRTRNSRRTKVAKNAVQLLINKNLARLKKLKDFLKIKQENKDAKAMAKAEKDLMDDFSAYNADVPVDAQVAMAEQGMMASPSAGAGSESPVGRLIIGGVLLSATTLVWLNRNKLFGE